MTEPRASNLSDASPDAAVQSAREKASETAQPSALQANLAIEALAAQAPANQPIFSAEETADVAAHIDDPCDEGGFDQFCRDRSGTLCTFHEAHCHAPDYPCLDLLRHHLAVVFLEDVTIRRRARRALSESSGASND